MKTSCQYPANEALIIIRKSQLDFCEGNACDAAVLSFLEYWHTIKSEHRHQAKGQNDIAEGHGDPRTQDETCWQFHTEQEIMEGIQCIRTSRSSIRGSIKRLEEKGILTTGRNPNPRYKFDRITWFLFHPEVMNDWLDNRSSNTEKTSSENERRWSDGLPPSFADKRTITEITPEITTEIPLEDTQTRARAKGHAPNGAVRVSDKNPYPQPFLDFWSIYPKKVGKDAALASWQRRKLNSEAPTIIAKVEEQARGEAWLVEGGRFIPNPATYLNQGRWKDEEPQRRESLEDRMLREAEEREHYGNGIGNQENAQAIEAEFHRVEQGLLGR